MRLQSKVIIWLLRYKILISYNFLKKSDIDNVSFHKI